MNIKSISKTKKQKGITLIALVITIIVLLILAGVSIQMLKGNNGIFMQAVKAKEQTETSSELEQVRLVVMSAMMENDGQLNTDVLDRNLKEYFPECKVYDIDNKIFVSEIDNKIYKTDLSGNIKENLIPDEYQRVEYIDKGSSVTDAYIDTKVEATSDIRVVINFQFNISTNAQKIPFGVIDFFAGIRADNSLFYCWGQEKVNNITTFIAKSRTNYKIDFSKNGFYVDDEKIADIETKSFKTGYDIYLGALNYNGVSSVGSSAGRIVIYDCKIYENNDLIRYFIPCYRKSDDHVGMYDVINDEFYMNQGTSLFKKGPDVSNNAQYCTKSLQSSDGTNVK